MKSILKRVVMMVALVVAIFFQASDCAAAIDYRQVSLSQLKSIAGDWYSTEGDLVLSIRNERLTIDGKTYKIISLGFTGDTVAFYKLTVDMGSDYGEIELISTGSYKGVHSILAINKYNYGLRDTKNPRYYESIGGVYLGMDKNQLVSLYGQPTNKTTVGRDECWIYSREGFEVHFNRWATNMISLIKIYPNGNRRFDRSGLSANSTRSEFASKYNTTVTRRGNLDIGSGEMIHIDSDGVTLQIITAGMIF